jgi:anaerobic selenocysteine-containing dehydrogenase
MIKAEELETKISRRAFNTGALAAIGSAGILAGCSGGDDDDDEAVKPFETPYSPDLREVRKVYSTCPVECLTHSLTCQLVGDHVVRVEPVKKDNDIYFTTGCARGMSRMQFLTENRAATPMKRIKRGTDTSPLGVVLKNNAIDSWVSISWQQAFQEIGSKLKALKNSTNSDDNRGIMVNTGSGNMGPVANGVVGTFFGYAAPKRTNAIGNNCCQAVDDGMTVIYGNRTVDTRDTIRQSKCIICWGNNPADTSNTYWKFHAEAKEAGAKIIVIDPRYSTSASLADQWIPLVPGTDSLFAIGMLRYIFSVKFADIDENFLKHRTNAAYLIDLSSAEEDDGTPVSLTTYAQSPWNKIQNLKYYTVTVGTEQVPAVYDLYTSTIVAAEVNTGRNGTPTQNPDLYYYNPATPNVITVYELMRALYAGDLLVSGNPTFAPAISAGFENLHDPTYNETYIVSTTGIDSIQVLQECANAYVGSGKKSMIIQNMGGGGRQENGGSHFALQCILSVITGNIGDPGNGVCDTSGYGAPQGFQTNDPARIATGSTYYASVPQPTPATYSVPFGVLGRRMRAANKGTPETSFVDPTSSVVDAPMQFWYVASKSLLTQWPNTDAFKEALCSTETVVVAHPTWNTDADYCDYFLPVTTPFEYVDLGAANRNKYVQVMEAGVRPYGAALSDMQIIRGLAKVVFDDDQPVAALFDHDDEFYVRNIIDNPANNFASNGIASYEDLKEKKSVRPSSIPSPWVPHRNHEFLGSRAIKDRKSVV